MIILTLNCGSSSVKFQLYDWEAREVLTHGLVERVGLKMSKIEIISQSKEDFSAEKPCADHSIAIEWILSNIIQHGSLKSIEQIAAVGHRVLHGGEEFKQSVIIDARVLATFESLVHLGPLHMPANLRGIRAAQQALPNVPHCAIMDTAWHQTMPKASFMYALPREWYKKYNVRRYGFHGTSFLYTAKRAAVLLAKDVSQTKLIIAHVGNGASVCAVKNGVSYDTSMGLTPLEGLIMGTRSGDIDPAIIPYMMGNLDLTYSEIDNILNKKSGISAITGKYTDRRDVLKAFQAGDREAKLAIDMECYRMRKYIGAYYAALGSVDAIVFTAGVGEMNPLYRELTILGLDDLGIVLDREKNESSTSRNCETMISAANSKVKIFVIPTDEELVITEDTHALIKGNYDIHTKFRYSFQEKDYVNLARVRMLDKDIRKNPKLKNIIL